MTCKSALGVRLRGRVVIDCAVCRLDRSRLRRVQVSNLGVVAVLSRSDPASDRGVTSSGCRAAATVRGVAVGGSCLVRWEAASPPYVAVVSFPDEGLEIALLFRRSALSVATGCGVIAVKATWGGTALVLPFLSDMPRFHAAAGLEGGGGR